MTEILKIQDRVHTSPSTIFTKGDVLNLLKELEYLQKAEAEAAAKEAPAPAEHVGFYSPKQVRDLVLSISESVEDRLINYDFSSEIEFELYGNQIEATVSTTDLVKGVMERIMETANEELDLKMA